MKEFLLNVVLIIEIIQFIENHVLVAQNIMLQKFMFQFHRKSCFKYVRFKENHIFRFKENHISVSLENHSSVS